MAANQYPCPECAAVLRPPKAINPGQKVKCPKCEKVFVPVPKKAEEDEEAGTYGVTEESAEEEARQSEEKQKALGPLRDRRPKSARGPAMALCTPPGNRMMATSSFTCVSSVVSIVVLLFPLLFAPKPKEPDPNLAPPPPPPADGSEPAKPKATPEKKPDNKALRFVNISVCVFAFAYNAMIVFGAVKMMSLESYPWGMGAAALIVNPFEYVLGTYGGLHWLFVLDASIGLDFILWGMVSLLVSAWCIYVGATAIKTLRDPKVLAGFAEKKPADI